jgi:single-stranded-DNA-specific exonuclease
LNYTYIKGFKYRWKISSVEKSKVREISQRHNLSIPIAQTLLSRGFETAEQITSFLFTSLEKDIAHPNLFKDSKKAVERILKAIEKKEKILIFGDYDVDGISSTALLLAALLPLGALINYFLPNRIRDGYGLSKKIVKKAAESNYKLIITVDNGITAIEAAQNAKELGVDLIITDHHRPHEKLPNALAIVNPNQKDCKYPYKDFAGVGVAFKLIFLLYEIKNIPLPEKIYELLTLGTIADVVPLLGENRFWVKHGLSIINKKKSYSLAVLANNSRLTKKFLGSLDIGFMLAPQLNALGRLDDSRDAVKFLISSEFSDVDRVGKLLKEMNEKRKKVERGIFDEIEHLIINKTIDLEKENIIMAASETWPAGVIGLVAGRLAHGYGKPSFLFHEKNGVLGGSCRSIPEFNIFNALKTNQDLLISFGGHSFAAGLKLKKENVEELKKRLEKQILEELTPEDLIPKIDLDAPIELSELNKKIISDLLQLEPFGNKNAQPTFIIHDVVLLKQPQLLKDKHVKCTVFSDGIIKPVIFFNRPDLYSFLCNCGDQPFSIAGHVMKNEWNERINIELQGLDIALRT